MSLDVYLRARVKVTCSCGHEHLCDSIEDVYSANITHNLNEMAMAAGIYKHLWRPEELGITKAVQLIDPLSKGFLLLENNPDRFDKLVPENGWGTYEELVSFVFRYLSACKEHPEADVFVSR